MHSQLANLKGNLNQRQQPQLSVTTVEADYGMSQPQQLIHSSAKQQKHGSVPNLHLNNAKPLRESFQENTRVIVHDNWLGQDEQNKSDRNARDPTSLLPGKQRFRLNYKKQWKKEQSSAQRAGPESDRSLVTQWNP